MSRSRLYAALAAVTVAVAVVVALLAWRAWNTQSGPVLEEEPIAGSARLEPEQHLFGDAVRAQLELVLDRDRVDPSSVDVGANFSPYRQLRPVQRTRSDSGPITRIRYDYLLGCLTPPCLPKGSGRVDFGGAAVEFKRRGQPQLDTATIEWPTLRAAGRIDPAQLERAALRAELRGLPPPSYRFDPKTVEVVALILAVLFAAAALILALRFLPLDRLAARLGARRADRMSPLERALALARESTAGGQPAEGRRALERLAHELRNTSKPELAGDASKLAWSKPPPGEDGFGELSRDVDRVIAEEA